ncbi:MAG: hypothetical protein AAGG68_27945 [Bacteroidota bacterium]
MDKKTVKRKAIRIREYSDEFEDALNQLKAIYRENTKTKTLEKAVIQCLELKQANENLKAKLQSAEAENAALIDKIKQYIDLETRKEQLLEQIKAYW